MEAHQGGHKQHAAKNKPESSGPERKQRAYVTVHSPGADVEGNRWPFCIVWTPLPILTWFVPLIGHTGIANSNGIVYDFSDDFNVTVDNLSFGTPTKYYELRPHLVPHGADSWDRAIQETSDLYARTRHSLFFNNCHKYIADVLNKVNYANRSDWTQTQIFCMITFRSSYTGCAGFVRQWIPFMGVVSSVILVLRLILSSRR